ncbi:hypothetical protein [Chryseobacterium aurantiacum]|uniref:hypothetical protein n=1 Tax=Chryseobacterium aurantiacum TaxID=2116499 RepID=UPI000D1289B9|nr:hypothetical protein [Chryseobacterium aurantiacum]
MKNLFFLITISFSTLSNAQNLKDFSIPKGYTKITEEKGDLDKDGKEETVIILETDQKASENKDYPEHKDFKRILYILKQDHGKLKIWKENSILLFSSGTGFYPEYNTPPKIFIKTAALSITQEFNTNSRHSLTYKHTFRFQNGDFYLIGAHENFADTCEFDFTYEINFSTGKVIVDKDFSSCNDNEKIPEDFYKEFTHKFQYPIKMENFKIGEHKFKIPGLKEDFIF